MVLTCREEPPASSWRCAVGEGGAPALKAACARAGVDGVLGPPAAPPIDSALPAGTGMARAVGVPGSLGALAACAGSDGFLGSAGALVSGDGSGSSILWKQRARSDL